MTSSFIFCSKNLVCDYKLDCLESILLFFLLENNAAYWLLTCERRISELIYKPPLWRTKGSLLCRRPLNSALRLKCRNIWSKRMCKEQNVRPRSCEVHLSARLAKLQLVWLMAVLIQLGITYPASRKRRRSPGLVTARPTFSIIPPRLEFWQGLLRRSGRLKSRS